MKHSLYGHMVSHSESLDEENDLFSLPLALFRMISDVQKKVRLLQTLIS